MMNLNERRNELAVMKRPEIREIAKGYNLSTLGVKADIIERILNYEWGLNNEELHTDDPEICVAEYSNAMVVEEQSPVWWNLVCEMNVKDGAPFVYEHVADRPLLQQIMLNVCRDLYLDSQRAIKAANGDKSVKQFGPVYVGKKHSGLHMKDAMAKSTVKTAAEKVLSKEQQKKYIILNPETKHTEFRQAVQVLEKLNGAGLIHGDDTDKDYAKFYTVNPEEILAFLKAVGCLKNNN